ncbi:hypothetical protein LguiB_018255 [Lonicera macranthoides]
MLFNQNHRAVFNYTGISMSFPDPPPPPLPFMPPPPFHGVDGGFWPQIPMNNEHPDSHIQQLDQAPPFKRPRNTETNLPNSSNYPMMNPLANPMVNKSSSHVLMNPSLNKGTCHIFYKTRICTRFMEGNCRNGENCTFAHGHQDLREPPPNWQQLVQKMDKGPAGDWNDDNRIIHRMKICRKFYNGEECPYGEKCNFLHESPLKFRTDIAMSRESSAISIGMVGPVVEQNDASDQQTEFNKNLNPISDALRMKPAYWKTKLCSKWETTGQCPFGERCHFAHGQSDLQAPPGGRVEAEVISNIGSFPARPLSSVPSVVQSTVVVGGALTEKESGGNNIDKSLLKWKVHKKINRIYADWLDDDPLLED